MIHRKRVIILTMHFPPPFTGAATRIWYMTKHLTKKGYEVYIVELVRRKKTSAYKFVTNKVITLPNKLRRWIRIFGLESLDYLKKINPDLVIATNPPREAVKIALRLFKDSSTIICDIHDITDEYKLLYGKIKGFIYRVYYGPLYNELRRCDLVLAATEAMARVIEQRTGKKVYPVLNGADIDLYTKAYETYVNKKVCDPYCIGVFLGSLDWEYQRLDSLIKALYILKKDYKFYMKLRIIGSGKLLPTYMKIVKELRIGDQVKFYGYINREQVPWIIASSDFGIVSRPAYKNAWIMTSMRMSIFDYLSSGIPILAYGPEISYTRIFIEKNRIGIYIGSDDPRILADHIFNNLKKLIGIKKRWCRKVAEKYKWENTLKPLLDYIQSLDYR